MKGKGTGYYHVCTEGLKNRHMFMEREDYLTGMNSIPICAMKSRVKILAFCLMDNHVHFILQGSHECCSAFISEYKRRHSQVLRNRYSEVQALHDVHVCIQLIDSEEYMRSSIAYVLRNPVAAGFRCLPFHYEWCSAGLYFSNRHRCASGMVSPARHKVKAEPPLVNSMAEGTLLSDLPRYIIEQILHTRHCLLPGNYSINEEGLVYPEHYVEIDLVEQIFSSPKRFMYYMSRNTDRENEFSLGFTRQIRFNDMQMKSAILQTCHEEFFTEKVEELDIEDKCRLMIMMKRRYGANARQLSRLTGISLEFLKQLIG